MNLVRLREINLGMEVSTTGGGMVLTDEYSCSVLIMNTERKPAVVRFSGCMQMKFGYPNDEALIGHALYGNCSYGVYEVIGSNWFDTLQEQNKARFPESKWVRKRHFSFIFHESMGEFLADDVQVEAFDGGFDDMALKAMQWALARPDTCPPNLLPHQEA
ncbi:hypothetical protein [Streptomyces sp. NRRL F-525]|uniref:hypothetical protein n=1 Tax=Streptomyces sp. NRRL F-525 TaxID=1463861 RepID=UPI00131D6456|nr:hypothetical protein [Streptomyces sp. NRRL F-525]